MLGEKWAGLWQQKKKKRSRVLVQFSLQEPGMTKANGGRIEWWMFISLISSELSAIDFALKHGITS